MKNNQIFTVIILCYRNFEFLYEAIDSVLNQTYKQIELIVSDDCSPNFPANEVSEYIKNHAKENIVSYFVNHESHNLGTVRHINHALSLSQGNYICFFAGDDAYYDANSLQNYVDRFNRNGDRYLVQMAHTAMYDRTLTRLRSIYMKPPIQSILEKENHDELFKWLSNSACLPSVSTCYKREFFKKFGEFPNDYFLVDDVPTHIRIARNHIPICYGDFFATKHRDGGISHGATGALSTTKIKYYNDLKRIYYDILKDTNQLDRNERARLKKIYRNKLIWLDSQIMGRNPAINQRIMFVALHPLYVLGKVGKKASRILHMGKILMKFGLMQILLVTVFRVPIQMVGIMLGTFDFLYWFRSIVSILSYLSVGVISIGTIMYACYLVFSQFLSRSWYPVNQIYEDCFYFSEIWR